MSSGITNDSLMLTAPNVLSADENMSPLVQMVAEALSNIVPMLQYPRLYTRIDELPEHLLDTMARDFMVEWYGFDNPIEVKRNTIRSSFDVHRHMATKGAFMKALSDVHPQSSVQEWFEYDGSPFCFRAIVNLTYGLMPLDLTTMLRTIAIYKPARAQIDQSMLVVVIEHRVNVETFFDAWDYHSRICGTYPRVGTRGDINQEQIEIGSEMHAQRYTTPRTGQQVSGTYPRRGTRGDAHGDDMGLSVDADSMAYTSRRCGASTGTLM